MLSNRLGFRMYNLKNIQHTSALLCSLTSISCLCFTAGGDHIWYSLETWVAGSNHILNFHGKKIILVIFLSAISTALSAQFWFFAGPKNLPDIEHLLLPLLDHVRCSTSPHSTALRAVIRDALPPLRRLAVQEAWSLGLRMNALLWCV